MSRVKKVVAIAAAAFEGALDLAPQARADNHPQEQGAPQGKAKPPGGA